MRFDALGAVSHVSHSRRCSLSGAALILCVPVPSGVRSRRVPRLPSKIARPKEPT